MEGDNDLGINCEMYQYPFPTLADGSIPISYLPESPGFKFAPDTEEIFCNIIPLKSVNPSSQLHLPIIDIFSQDPETLQTHNISVDKWVFSRIVRKHKNGMVTNRSGEHGYWKTTGKLIEYMMNNKRCTVKSYVHNLGKVSSSVRTDWALKEFRIGDVELGLYRLIRRIPDRVYTATSYIDHGIRMTPSRRSADFPEGSAGVQIDFSIHEEYTDGQESLFSGSLYP
uniref:PV1 n=1 Tax=European wheat striate mosaic virus TaxID=2661631 RepID=A0A5P9K5K2_9VIRU|nr:pV1 [European wheat striate mosaic virus]